MKVVDLGDEFAFGSGNLIRFYNSDLSRFDKAMAIARKYQNRNPEDIGPLTALADINLNLGDLAAVEENRERMIELDADHLWIGVVGIQINLLKNNPDGAREVFAWLLPKMTDAP